VAELVFVLTDFFSAAGCGGPGDCGPAGLPRLPLLETLFARSRVTALDSDWRGWLAERYASESMRASTPAAIVAAAWCGPAVARQASEQVWLATPVHYFAGLDSVHLHPAGLLRLDDQQQQRLVTDFARVFADSPWTLRSIGQRELLLSGPAIAASGADPAQFAGSDPSAGLPRGEGAGTLRGLGAEMEMWLYEHPLNLERLGHDELPVTTLWLWGATTDRGTTRPTQEHTPVHALHARLYGRDTYAAALWQLQGAAAHSLPASFDAASITADADDIFLYSLLQPEGLSAALLQLEQRWLSGALQALRRRRVSVLRLLAGGHAYSLRWLDLVRFWRAPAPWWETLA
jgi:hypothetical protein